MLLPDDIDIKTALDMLAIFKERLNSLVVLDNVITPEGRVLVKGGAIHNLLVEIVKCEKQLRLDRAYNATMSKRIQMLDKVNTNPDWHDEDEKRCQNMR